jgi:anti-sigma B factor antagonist
VILVVSGAATVATTGGAQVLDGSFPVEVVDGVPVLVAPEEIDITNAEALRSALLKAAGLEAARPKAAADGRDALVVDMTRTRFCDSAGLQVLIAAHKRAEAEGGELLLVIPSRAVLRVFAITGADRMIPNFTSLPEALAKAIVAAAGGCQQEEGASQPGNAPLAR